MACNTKHGPAHTCIFLKEMTGVPVTQEDWHAIRDEVIKATGKPLARTRVTNPDIAYTSAENLALSMGATDMQANDFANNFSAEFNTEGTLAVLNHLTQHGLPVSVTERKRRGDGKPRSPKPSPAPTVNPVSDDDHADADRCEACQQFSDASHRCPPEKLREYAMETDVAAAALYEEQWKRKQHADMRADDLHRMSGEKQYYNSRNQRVWRATTDEAIAILDAKIAEFDASGETYGRLGSWSMDDVKRTLSAYQADRAEIARLGEEIKAADGQWRKFGWNRAFLVVTNGQGHVHKSMGCSTCYPTTRFNWLPAYSGSDEDQIVADAGERACTICYPSAPVDVLSRPSKIFSEDERKKVEEKVARDAERERKRLAKAAKAPTANGSPLVVVTERGINPAHVRNPGQPYERKETFTNETTARSWATDKLAESYGPPTPVELTAIEDIAQALAGKYGVDAQVIWAQLQEKADAKKKKNAKEQEKMRAQHPEWFTD